MKYKNKKKRVSTAQIKRKKRLKNKPGNLKNKNEISKNDSDNIKEIKHENKTLIKQPKRELFDSLSLNNTNFRSGFNNNLNISNINTINTNQKPISNMQINYYSNTFSCHQNNNKSYNNLTNNNIYCCNTGKNKIYNEFSNNNINTNNNDYTKLILKKEFYNNNFMINNNNQAINNWNMNLNNNNQAINDYNINLNNNNQYLNKTMKNSYTPNNLLVNENKFPLFNKNEIFQQINDFNGNILNEKIFSRTQYENKIKEQFFKQLNNKNWNNH